MRDPFNAAIVIGLLLAARQTPTSNLGFFGKAVAQLAGAQTPILFLIIGLKFKLTGAAPALCASLLLMRHGIVAFGTAAFLKLCLPILTSPSSTASAIAARSSARLAAVLSSQVSRHACMHACPKCQSSSQSQPNPFGYPSARFF